jgi:large subunit ribosomal protein L23
MSLSDVGDDIKKKVVFRISDSANKISVAKAVNSIFGVDVVKVNIINVLGKTKRFKRSVGKRSDYRKAVVTLLAGQSIEFSSGVL